MPITRKGVDMLFPIFNPAVGPDLVDREDILFEGIPVRIYRPKNKTSGMRGALVYYHGGGWVFGSIDSYDGLTAYYAVQANIVVVSVEYRLAPEFPYPIPLEDCTKATELFIQNAAKYNVEPKRIAVGGDSAGGNLAAAVSLVLRNRKFQPMPRLQLMIYPVTQLINLNTPSYFKLFNILPDRSGHAALFQQYLNLSEEYIQITQSNEYISPAAFKKVSPYMDINVLPKGFVSDDFKPTTLKQLDKRISPEIEARLLDPCVSILFAPDLSNLPEAFVFTAGGDTLRDDGAFYAHRLKQAGLKTTWLDIPETFHGCVNGMNGIFRTETGQRANFGIITFLKKTLR